MGPDEVDRQAEIPLLLAEALAADYTLARDHGVVFGVASRLSDPSPARREPPEFRGGFESPADAVAYAMTLRDRDVTVVADGHGSYWSPSEPDRVDSWLLQMVCRDRRLGPEEAERERERQELRDVIARHRADQRFSAALAVVRGAATVEEAKERLEGEPLFLSPIQAAHLLGRRALGLLAQDRQQEIEAALAEATAALDELGPSIEEPPDR